MSQLFTPRANLIAWASTAGMVILLTLACLAWAGYVRSEYATGVNMVVDQPVPFSHQHHVGQMGLDCRYCHKSVEHSSSAGMPATQTCMNCHQQLWPDADLLDPVRQSWRKDEPIRWNRVHDLPDYVYFNHSIHVDNGISCVSCHGRVDKMPLTKQKKTLFMYWCLDCHRHPEQHIRPKEKVFDMDWQPPKDREKMGKKLVKQYHINQVTLTNCSTCHR